MSAIWCVSAVVAVLLLSSVSMSSLAILGPFVDRPAVCRLSSWYIAIYHLGVPVVHLPGSLYFVVFSTGLRDVVGRRAHIGLHQPTLCLSLVRFGILAA